MIARRCNRREAVTENALDSELLAILVCPLTRTKLRYDADANELVSDEAGLAYPVRAGVPVMLVEEARRIEG
jgi:hypothetical protein